MSDQKYDTAEETGGLDFYGAVGPHIPEARRKPGFIELALHAADTGTTVARLEADARALWAVRVLDAWADLRGRDVRQWRHDPYSYCELSDTEGLNKYYADETPDAARLAAAEAVFPTLPADVRAKLGERP